MSGLEESTLEKKQKQVSQLLNDITSYSDISILDIVLYLGYKEEQHSSFNKCAQGIRFPKFLNSKISAVLEKLEQGAKNPDLIREFIESMTKEENKSYKKPPKSYLVWIPFDLNLPVADYNGINPPLSFIQMGEQKGIVTFRNTSKYNADGEIYIDHIGMATDIEPGTRIALRRINKMDWQPDRYYLIVDASGQPSIWELLAGDDEKTVRCVSTNPLESRHKVLQLDRIEAIFSIVDGNCIPKPKRNSVSAAASQQ